MSKNSLICGIEHALSNEGCNEIPVENLFVRVKKTRGNFDASFQDFMTVLIELESDGLFEFFLEDGPGTLVARSQMHPSVPISDPVAL